MLILPLIHCMVCRDCSHTFVSFQTVMLFVIVTDSARIRKYLPNIFLDTLPSLLANAGNKYS